MSDLPSLTFSSDAGNTVRHFTDKLPIGIGEDGRTYVFLYLATRPVPVDFRMFLERHAELLRALPAWSVRVLIPHHLVHATHRYQDAFREQVGMPLRPTQLEELRWFFEARRSSDQQARRAIRSRETRVWRHRGFECCIAPGSSRETVRSTRSSRPRLANCDRATDGPI